MNGKIIMLKIYCINLEKRSDRWSQIQLNFQLKGLPASMVQRWNAIPDEEFGALGCAKSHVAVLANFLTKDNEPYCLILEDDFEFIRPWNEFIERFNEIAGQSIEWDALLLTGTQVLAYGPQLPGVAKVLEAQTTAGYFLSRRYAAQVLGCFAESVSQMELMRDKLPNSWLIQHYAIDVAWKYLQRRDRWYIFSPAFGRQRPGFSDIENCEVSYDKLTYGLI